MLELAQELYRLRKQKNKTLKHISSGAKISTAYLQKLEQGKVNSPSPHVLRRLAEVLEVSYLQLMRLAGYLPDHLPESSVPAALHHQDLSDEQWRAVAAFINYLKNEP